VGRIDYGGSTVRGIVKSSTVDGDKMMSNFVVVIVVRVR
jgi:hypothetical protein